MPVLGYALTLAPLSVCLQAPVQSARAVLGGYKRRSVAKPACKMYTN